MGVVVRIVEEADRPVVEAIARESLTTLMASPSVAQWGARMRQAFIEGWLPTRVTSDRHRFLVAELDGEVVGGGSVQHGDRHPHAFMRICVRPNLRSSGFGAAILESLTAEDAGPFVVREMLSDPATISFYENRGFVTGERTLEGLIDPVVDPVRAWCDSELDRSSDVVIEEVGGRASEEEIAEAADRLYGWTHAWSPPRLLSAVDAVRSYLGHARRGGVLGAWMEGDLVGVSLLTDSPFTSDRGVARVAFCGVVQQDVRAASDVTRRLLACTLQQASRQGWVVQVEANDGNEFLWDALKDLPETELFSDLALLVSRPGVLDAAPVT